jgi:fluoride exporter
MPLQYLGRSHTCRALPSRSPCRFTRAPQLKSHGSMKLAIVLVLLGGAAGSMWRFWWSGLVAQRFGETFPFGTLVVNIVGSTIIGVVAGFLTHVSNSDIATALQQLLAVGICGGLTTFSSFGLQTYNLIVDGRWLLALSNIVLSTGLCLGCVAVGWQVTQGIRF